jgi:hypothetical protein
MGRHAARVLIALSLAAACAGAASPHARQAFPKDFLWALDSSPAASPSADGGELTWRGGSAGAGALGVERTPSVYVVFWGPLWAKGFPIADTDGRTYSSATLQRYVRSFFAGIGGSAWADVQTQYCSGTRPGATSCAGGSGFVSDPLHQLKGVWVDPSPVPADVLELGTTPHVAGDPVVREARRAAGHFGYRRDATYVVLAQPGPRLPRGPVWCGYHSQASTQAGRIQYAFIPWLDADWPNHGRTACGMHAVNVRSTAFGNGVFDGYSIVLGHEYAEAVTDPDNFSNVQDGWNDATSTESADKCQWRGLRDVELGGRRFAVQPLWSNEAYAAGDGGCVVSR